MHIHTTSLKLACTALLCLLQNIYVAADYQFEVNIRSYSNPGERDAEGDCCETGCTSACEPYFDSFCLRSSGHSHSDLTTCSLGSSGRRIEIESLPETVTIAGTGPWPGGFQLYIRVQDEDTFSSDDLIDRIFADSNIRPSSTFSNTLSFRGYFGIVTLGLQFMVTCSQDYYGDDCNTFCQPRNDNGGHYNCDGNGNIVCLDGFTEPSSNCITLVDCGSLASPTNGQVTFSSGTTFGSTATYTCNSGYSLVGSSTRTCQTIGTWSGSAPTCEVVDCGSLASPTNGQVTFSGGTTFGSTATYTCNSGFGRVGSVTRTCQATGTWSGSAPTCEADCGSLPNPSNGRVTFSSGTTSGSVATYTCNTGYSVVGSATRTCQTTGTWSGTAPTCEDTTDDCEGADCPENSMCVDGVNSFECVCNPGFQCEESESEAAVSTGLAVGVSVVAGVVLIFCVLCVICIFVVIKYRQPKRTPEFRGSSSSARAQMNQQYSITVLPSSEHQAQPVATPGLPTIPPNATDVPHANYGMFNEPPPPSYTAAVGYPQPQYSNPLFTGYPQEAAVFPPPSAPPRSSAI